MKQGDVKASPADRSISAESSNLARRFSAGLLWNYSGRVLEYGARFLFFSLIAAALGPREFGIFSFAISVHTIATLIFGLGFENALNNFVPEQSAYPARQAYLLRTLLRWRALILLAAVILLWAEAAWLADRSGVRASAIRWVIPYVVGYNLTNLISYFLVGRLEMTTVTGVRVGIQLLNLGVGGCLLARGARSEPLLGVMGASTLLAALVLLWQARRFLTGPAEPMPMGRVYRFGLTLGLTNGLNYVLGQQADILLLGLLLRDPAEMGFYNLAATLTLIATTGLLLGFEGVSQTALVEAAMRGGQVLRRFYEAMLRVTATLSQPILLFAVLHVPSLIRLYGPEYEPAIPLLTAYLAYGFAMRFMGGGLNTATLYALRREHIPLTFRAIGGVLNIALAVWWIPWWGALGAILATATSGFLMGLLEQAFTMRLSGSAYPIRYALKLLLVMGVAGLLSRPIDRGTPITLAASALLYALLFCAGWWGMRPLSEADRESLSRMSPRLGIWLTRIRL
ncbi:MAG: oligosaccharide flippase family protein [Anaerolineae bacterium]|nr:oligosaccharide flippase family protein [Anaerolineae bacterium]MDW8098481.1 oligosaccharide flippase family protein [Anaerolineae bacterium]